jgi:RNA polymerase sigma-70 factor (ECF subfamily)
MGLQDADAADVSQDVLAEVARCNRAFEYDPERGRFRDWLGILVRRKVLRFRKNHDDEAADLRAADANASDANSVDAEWTDEFNAQILSAAIERARPHFEPQTWSAFEGVWLKNRRAVDVAADLKLPIELVYTAKSRVLKRLEEEVRVLAEDVPQLVRLK